MNFNTFPSSAEKPVFLKSPLNQTIHDYAEFESKVRAEGIPQPTIHWTKDGKRIEEEAFKETFAVITENQVSSDIRLDHFGTKHVGDVSERKRASHSEVTTDQNVT